MEMALGIEMRQFVTPASLGTLATGLASITLLVSVAVSLWQGPGAYTRIDHTLCADLWAHGMLYLHLVTSLRVHKYTSLHITRRVGL